jgi:hypothetical protein
MDFKNTDSKIATNTACLMNMTLPDEHDKRATP